MTFNEDARLLVNPFRVYRELALEKGREDARVALGKATFFLFVIGAFVSFTTAGRLVAFHVATTAIFWAFVPLLQAGALLLALRSVSAGTRSRRALRLYFSGHAPWSLFLVAMAGVVLIAPDVHRAMTWLLASGVLPAALFGTLAWGGVLTFACFRAGLGLSGRRAAAATALFYLAYGGSLLGYYLANNQIQPQFPGIP